MVSQKRLFFLHGICKWEKLRCHFKAFYNNRLRLKQLLQSTGGTLVALLPFMIEPKTNEKGNSMSVQFDANEVISDLDLNLVITDRNILSYLAQFDDEDTRSEKAVEALKVGVIAIQSASPTLDTTVVQSHFGDLESQMRDSLTTFQRDVKGDLTRYFADGEGIVPKSIENFFGETGKLAGTFQRFFDPEDGRLSQLIRSQIGPDSSFGKSLDPENKQGVIAVLEARVQELVEAKLDDVLKEFSLDEDGSAMNRMQLLLSTSFEKINRTLGHIEGTAEESEKGHVKGIRFEKELYDDFFVNQCVNLDDEPALVRGKPGFIDGCKTGDLLATLGETTGAPGENIVVEVKEKSVRFKEAIDELQEAKRNRRASVGIFVFAKGHEPDEVGDFRRVGEDYYCTVDRDDLAAGRALMYFDAAYKIARTMVVAAARKDSVEEVDLKFIEEQVDSLIAWSDRIEDMSTKARTIQKSGRLIEEVATDLKAEFDRRLKDIQKAIRC